MKRSEEAVETVLAGLRDVEAPVGMERRILEAVEKRAVERAEAPFWAAWRVGALPVAGCAVVAGMIAAAVIISSHRLALAPTRAEMGRAAMTQAPATATAAAAAEAAEVSANEVQPLAVGAVELAAQPMHRISVRRARIVRGWDSRDRDSVAMREMRAASHPAPPLPLTEQEKMLLRVAQVGDAQEMAMLNPEIRAEKEAQSDQEFQRFFERTAATDNE